MVSLTVLPARSDTLDAFEFPVSRPVKHQIRWPSRKIAIALSSSLASPGPNFKIGTDAIGAARRAISRWARVANISFVETSASVQSISSARGDGLSLITIANTPENNAIFASPELTGRTRVFYEPETGIISEADICVNPHPALGDGTPVQFSTDGTPGTYDLESTFTHEIGHLLGLDHSVVWASTMQARQGLNGVYGLTAFSGRTISEEDLERVRSLYGSSDRTGVITGQLSGRFSGAQVWVENIATGRVTASSLVSLDGSYRVESLLPGQYRVLVAQPVGATGQSERVSKAGGSLSGLERPSRAAELANEIVVSADAVTPVNANTIAPQGAQFLNPRFVGINGEISTVALPLEAGGSFKVYLGGEGLDQVTGTGISVTSPFFKLDPNTLVREQFASTFPVISFTVMVAPNVPFGDYTIRVLSTSGEVAYLPGSITIDPGVNSTAANPVDDDRFFVSQHYRDFLGRDPDPEGLDYWLGQLQQCGQDDNCTRARRLGISAAFFGEGEFQETGLFVYGLFRTLGRRPTFAEFNADRGLLVTADGDFAGGRKLLARAFVRRREFLSKYPESLNAQQFVDSLLAETQQASGDRAHLLALYDGSDAARAAIVNLVVTSPGFVRAEYNRAYVLMQYFAYLRRDPDEAGYNFWLNALQNKPIRDSEAFRGVACGFLSSAEYQLRFGMIVTHTPSECTH